MLQDIAECKDHRFYRRLNEQRTDQRVSAGQTGRLSGLHLHSVLQLYFAVFSTAALAPVEVLYTCAQSSSSPKLAVSQVWLGNQRCSILQSIRARVSPSNLVSVSTNKIQDSPNLTFIIGCNIAMHGHKPKPCTKPKIYPVYS